MTQTEKTIYIDISQFLLTRKTTGIQRVIRELLSRIIKNSAYIHILDIDRTSNNFMKLDNNEIQDFLKDIQNYKFISYQKIDIFDTNIKNKFFVEIDTVWNADIQRAELYPKLKRNGFKIVNIIYDLIPILFPHYLYKESRENFPNFIKSVYNFSDLVIFNSTSSKNDFFQLQNELKIKRKMSTKVVALGSNFTKKSQNLESKYKELLSKKYILFVGTIEPRKEQLKVLQVFSEIQKQHTDLQLIFIGKIAWGTDEFNSIYNAHPLKEKNIHHLSDINDDELSLFYQHASIVTYLSKYEGYGLPLVEALSHHKVTIASNNSSMAEFSNASLDFVEDETPESLKKLLLYYLDNPSYLDLRTKEIKKNYKMTTWDDFYSNLIKIIENFDILRNQN